MEWMISGYCRAQDQARTVLLELENGQWDWGCDYPGCLFSDSCLVAKELKQIQQEAAT